MKGVLLSLYFLVLFPEVLHAQDSLAGDKKAPLSLHGYVKDLQSFQFIDRMSSLVNGSLVHNRLNLRYDLSESLYLRTEVRNRLFIGEQVKVNPDLGLYLGEDDGIVDLSFNVVDDTTVLVNTSIDRLLLNWSKEKWEVTLGRQRINWGVNLVWNPNDIFNAFNYFDFDYEERPGVDAFRLHYFSGTRSSYEFAFKINKIRNEQVAAVLYKTNFKTYDIQGLAGIYFNDVVAGAGWAGNLAEVGFKGEVSYFHPYRNIVDTLGTLTFSVTADKSFKNELFGTVSYLFCSNTTGSVSGVIIPFTSRLSAKNLMPFTHTFFAQVFKSVNPLVNLGIAIIYAPENNSTFYLPSISMSLSNNFELALIGQSFFAVHDESYKTLGNAIYLRLRWSF